MITICTPTRDSINAGTVFDLINLVKESPELVFTTTQGSLLPNLRTLLVETSIKNGATHILFIDSDMRFPPDTLKRLLAHDLDVVGANCAQRTQDASTARKNDQFITSISKTGIEEVDTIGFGVTLIKKEVFDGCRKPWFATPYDGVKHVGEDVYFASKLKGKNKIFVDHDLSQLVKHIGNVELGVK